MGLTPTNPGLAATNRSVASNAGAGASLGQIGTQVAALGALDATLLLGQVVPPIYVPRGQFFLVEASGANAAASFAFFCSDVPASEGAFEQPT